MFKVKKSIKSNSQSPRRTRGCLWWGLRVVAVIILLPTLVFLTAFITEKVALAQLQEAYPPPGKMIPVGEHDWHLYCTGDPAEGPVVVVSSGYSSSSLHWVYVQPEVTKFAPICAYDRPGSGYSFEGLEPRTYHQEAEELHTLLFNAGVADPYILVGHSYGGGVMQVYASLYPEEVAGMVMVDANTPGSDARLPEEYVQASDRMSAAASVFSVPGVFRMLNWFGVYRNDPFIEKMPPDVQTVAYHLDYNSRMFKFQAVMGRADAEGEALFSQMSPLPDVPLIVITHGIPWSALPGVDEATAQEQERVLQEMQAELTASTSDSTLVVAEKSGHNIIVEQPDVIVEAIRTLVTRVRGE